MATATQAQVGEIIRITSAYGGVLRMPQGTIVALADRLGISTDVLVAAATGSAISR